MSGASSAANNLADMLFCLCRYVLLYQTIFYFIVLLSGTAYTLNSLDLHNAPCFKCCFLDIPTNAELSREFELLKTWLHQGLQSNGSLWLPKARVARQLWEKWGNNQRNMLELCVWGAWRKPEAVLEENTQLWAKNVLLKRTYDVLCTKIILLEQYSLSNNNEIWVAPIIKDSIMVLQSIAIKIDCPLATNDIDIVHCVPTSDRTWTSLVVRFVSRTKKLELKKYIKSLLIQAISPGHEQRGNYTFF